MPNQTMINAYKKLFGVSDDAQAVEGIRQHMSRIMEIRQRARDRADEEYSPKDLFEGGYFNFCEKQLKIVWTKNLMHRLGGEELDRNTAQVTDEFGEYMRGINALLRERGVEDAPNVDEIFEEGLDDEGEVTGWLTKWKADVLNKVPSTKTGVAQFFFYGRNPETNEKPSVKEALGRVRAEVASACESVNGDNAEEKCAKAVLVLRAVEEKHASRSGWWKFFHPINNYRENKAIEQLREQVRGSFSEEQIAAARAQTNGEAAWLVEEKGDSVLPSGHNELKVNPLESEAETRRRAEEEIAQAETERELLGMLASDIHEREEFLADEKYREEFGDTFEDALDEEAEARKAFGEDKSDFVDEFAEEKEALFVSEAEEPAQEEKSEPSQEKDAPELGKDLK